MKGKLEKLDWITISREYDIFINTTNYDNHPITLLEVMALGLPIVSTDVGGIPHLISNNETGILVPPNAADLMVEKILSLINGNVDTKSLTFNARKFVENYDISKILPQWFSLIEDVKNETGVFYIYNHYNEIIYIEASKNIKNRINNVICNNKNRWKTI